MKPREFFNQLEHDAIVKAIAGAESRTNAEIRVFISHRKPADPVAAAQKIFHRLGMHKSAARNGVLLFVAPRARKFAVIGDSAVHARCGDGFWNEVTTEMTGYFRKGEFTEGLLHGVRRAGELLTSHFPRRAGDKPPPPSEVDGD